MGISLKFSGKKIKEAFRNDNVNVCKKIFEKPSMFLFITNENIRDEGEIFNLILKFF